MGVQIITFLIKLHIPRKYHTSPFGISSAKTNFSTQPTTSPLNPKLFEIKFLPNKQFWNYQLIEWKIIRVLLVQLKYQSLIIIKLNILIKFNLSHACVLTNLRFPLFLYFCTLLPVYMITQHLMWLSSLSAPPPHRPPDCAEQQRPGGGVEHAAGQPLPGARILPLAPPAGQRITPLPTHHPAPKHQQLHAHPTG